MTSIRKAGAPVQNRTQLQEQPAQLREQPAQLREQQGTELKKTRQEQPAQETRMRGPQVGFQVEPDGIQDLLFCNGDPPVPAKEKNSGLPDNLSLRFGKTEDLWGDKRIPIDPLPQTGAGEETFGAFFDRVWGNNNGVFDDLEKAMHFAAYSINKLYGSSLRMTSNMEQPKNQFDAGGIYIKIDEEAFNKGFLDPLEKQGVPMTLEAKKGMLLEIAAPQHLKKAMGKFDRRDILELVAKTMARQHVPINDYLAALSLKSNFSAYKDVLFTMNTFLAEAERIGWDGKS